LFNILTLRKASKVKRLFDFFFLLYFILIISRTESFHGFYAVFRAQLELQEIESSLQSESNSTGKLQEASMLLHKSMAPPVLEDVVEEAEGDQETLQVLQTELNQLQDQYDEVVKEKYSLAQICQQLSERLKSANFLLDR